MNAKFVFEALTDVLKPKSKEDIISSIKNDDDPERMLQNAIKIGYIEGIQYALQIGARGRESSWKNSRDYFIQFLIKHRNEIINEKYSQKTINDFLKKSCQQNSPLLVKYALEHGAEVDFRDGFGSTPLYYACKSNASLNVISILLENGADINSKNNDGMTPLAAAATPSGNVAPVMKDTIKFLIENGADIYIKNDHGYNALDHLMRDGALVYQLLSTMDISLTDSNKRSIIRDGSLKLIDMLLTSGKIQPNETLDDGSKPIDSINLRYNDQAPSKINLLMKHGAQITPNLRKEYKNIRHSMSSMYTNEKTRAKLAVIFESDGYVGNILKPKNNKEIVSSIVQETIIETLNGKIHNLIRHTNGSFKISRQMVSLDYVKNIIKENGPGFYLWIADDITNIPLNHIFSFRYVQKAHWHVLKYEIHENDIEFALSEIVSNFLNGDLGVNIHFLYDKPKTNESLFQPKPQDEITDDVVSQLIKNASEHKVAFYGIDSRGNRTLNKYTGSNFMDSLAKFGYGVYLHVNDEFADDLKEIFWGPLNVSFSGLRLGRELVSTFKILSTDKLQDLLRVLVNEMGKGKLTTIMLKRIR